MSKCRLFKKISFTKINLYFLVTSFLSRYPTFEARDQEFKQMALLGPKHPLLLHREKVFFYFLNFFSTFFNFFYSSDFILIFTQFSHQPLQNHLK